MIFSSKKTPSNLPSRNSNEVENSSSSSSSSSRGYAGGETIVDHDEHRKTDDAVFALNSSGTTGNADALTSEVESDQ